jgi:hypothetical protein
MVTLSLQSPLESLPVVLSTVTTMTPSPCDSTLEHLIALPTLSCELSSLPQAKTMESVSIHPTTYVRSAESEAKVS